MSNLSAGRGELRVVERHPQLRPRTGFDLRRSLFQLLFVKISKLVMALPDCRVSRRRCCCSFLDNATCVKLRVRHVSPPTNCLATRPAKASLIYPQAISESPTRYRGHRPFQCILFRNGPNAKIERAQIRRLSAQVAPGFSEQRARLAINNNARPAWVEYYEIYTLLGTRLFRGFVHPEA